MKTRERIIEEIKKVMSDYRSPHGIGSTLGNDMMMIQQYAGIKNYNFNATDAFAIGYMAGQSGLESIFNNEDELRKAVDLYDEKDATNRFDTVAETLHDLFDYEFSK